MEKTDDIRVVLVTADKEATAKRIAKDLVSKKIAACCSVVPKVTSFFEWEDKIEEREEFLIIIKTAAARLYDLEKLVLELSDDDVPEILALPVGESLGDYYKWLIDLVK